MGSLSLDTIKYLICKHFGDYDIYKFNSQPAWWLQTIWEHMNSEGQATPRHQQQEHNNLMTMAGRR